MIPVTKTFLPDQEEFNAILKRAWDAGWITNNGILVQELGQKLRTFLGVENIILTTNGTLPIQIAIKALGLTGEIITTPFSYVATTSAIVWENCKPVFVDIDPIHWTIDENKIEEKITSKTTAILATHVFGNPCNVEVIDDIANRHGLKVIYDAAHCFGVKYKGQSIFNYGDISTCSFHATKIFHTGEGGAIFSKYKSLHDRCFYHHNFGHKGQEEFHGLGINAKMSDLQAAMGLSVLPHIDNILNSRKLIAQFYTFKFKGKFKLLDIRKNVDWNYSYFPILFEEEELLIDVLKCLKLNQIYPRRYFFPDLTTLPYVDNEEVPIASSVSMRILCVPIYHNLELNDQKKVVKLILDKV